MKPNIYPLTVVKDRYTGVYSGGKYTAWNLDFYEVPEDIAADDVTCSIFWYADEEPLAGRGDTPQEAIDDLLLRIQKEGVEK